MEKVHQVIKCVEKCPSEADVIDLKSQLSEFTRDNLRAACSRLKLSVRDEQKKKSGLISVLVSYWNTSKSLVWKNAKSPVPASESPVKTGMDSPYDVAQFVQRFPPHGCIEELHSQLDACRSRTLRVACVLLGLEPKKTFTKQDFYDDLVTYWRSICSHPDSSHCSVDSRSDSFVSKVYLARPIHLEIMY